MHTDSRQNAPPTYLSPGRAAKRKNEKGENRGTSLLQGPMGQTRPTYLPIWERPACAGVFLSRCLAALCKARLCVAKRSTRSRSLHSPRASRKACPMSTRLLFFAPILRIFSSRPEGYEAFTLQGAAIHSLIWKTRPSLHERSSVCCSPSGPAGPPARPLRGWVHSDCR